MIQPRSEDAFQCGVDLGEQATDPIRCGGDLPGEVVVEPGHHGQLGDGLVVELERPQGVRHGPGGGRDDGGISGVGLRRTRVQVGDPAHRQAREVGHRDAFVQGDGYRQGADRGRLVDDQQHRSVGLHPAVELAELGLVVGQRPVQQFLPRTVLRDGVVSFL